MPIVSIWSMLVQTCAKQAEHCIAQLQPTPMQSASIRSQSGRIYSQPSLIDSPSTLLHGQHRPIHEQSGPIHVQSEPMHAHIDPTTMLPWFEYAFLAVWPWTGVVHKTMQLVLTYSEAAPNGAESRPKRPQILIKVPPFRTPGLQFRIRAWSLKWEGPWSIFQDALVRFGHRLAAKVSQSGAKYWLGAPHLQLQAWSLESRPGVWIRRFPNHNFGLRWRSLGVIWRPRSASAAKYWTRAPHLGLQAWGSESRPGILNGRAPNQYLGMLWLGLGAIWRSLAAI
jgi:hypothetical protein